MFDWWFILVFHLYFYKVISDEILLKGICYIWFLKCLYTFDFGVLEMYVRWLCNAYVNWLMQERHNSIAMHWFYVFVAPTHWFDAQNRPVSQMQVPLVTLWLVGTTMVVTTTAPVVADRQWSVAVSVALYMYMHIQIYVFTSNLL